MKKTPASSPSARTDLLSAGVWIAFGLATAVGAWRMDRLAEQGATLYVAPGFVPGLLALVLVALGWLLARRSVQRGAIAQLAQDRTVMTKQRRIAAIRVGSAFILTMGYALGLVGHLSFALATFLFVFFFILLFSDKNEFKRFPNGKEIMTAIIIAAGTAAVIDAVFENVFLVRLP
jgi:hypothetical protein